MSNWLLDTDGITRLQFELTNYCNASCPQCARAYYFDLWHHEFMNKDTTPYPLGINNTQFDKDKYKSILNNDNWSRLKSVHFCGTYDEPTIHPDFYELCEFTLQRFEHAQLTISTNGGTRSPQWWQELGRLGKKHGNRIKVLWGIDGLEDTNHMYRRGVKWAQLQANFQAYNDATSYNKVPRTRRGRQASEWQFIVFDHNKHQLQWVKDNFKTWGFDSLKVVYSNRPDSEHLDYERKDTKRAGEYKDSHKIKTTAFYENEPNDTANQEKIQSLKQLSKIQGTTNHAGKRKKKSFSAEKITELNRKAGNLDNLINDFNHGSHLKAPKSQYFSSDEKENKPILCKATRSASSLGRSLYVSCKGFVTPCCWMGTDEAHQEASNTFARGMDPKIHSIYSYDSMSELLNSEYFVKLKRALHTWEYGICVKNCSQTQDWSNQKVVRF